MEARAARDLWRDVAPLAGSPAPPSGGLGIGWPAPTAAPAPAVAPQRPPLWWIGDRLASSRARRPAPQLRPAPRASPQVDRGSAAPAPAPVAQLHGRYMASGTAKTTKARTISKIFPP